MKLLIKYEVLILLIIFNLGFHYLSAEDIKIDQAEMDTIKANIDKAGQENIDVGLSFDYYTIFLKNNPTTLNPLKGIPYFDSSLGFNLTPDWRTKLNIILKSKSSLKGDYEYTKAIDEAFKIEFEIAGINSSLRIMMGGPYWEIGSSPLTLGYLPTRVGASVFERRPWYEVIIPEKYYQKTFAEGKIPLEEREFSGLKGISLEYLYMPLKLVGTGFLGKTEDNYQNGNWLWFGKFEKDLFNYNVGVQYAGHISNPNNTRINDSEDNLFSLKIKGETLTFEHYIEIAYSLSRRPKLNKEADGFALISNLSRRLFDELFFIYNFDMVFKFYYATPEFSGNDNAVYNAAPVFSSDEPLPVSAIETTGKFYSGSTTLYLINAFNLLFGRVNISLGGARDKKETPNLFKLAHHLNHKEWHNIAGGFSGYSGLEQDWDTDYEGASETIYFTGSSKKYYSLFRMDLSYNLADWINFGFPIYYISRNIRSAISKEQFIFPTATSDYKILEYNYSEHFFALGITPEFYIVALKSIEEYIVDYNGSKMEMNGYGSGIGWDWFFTGGIAMYTRLRWFEHKDRYREQFNFDGYSFTLSFSKYFTY